MCLILINVNEQMIAGRQHSALKTAICVNFNADIFIKATKGAML